MFDNMDIFLLTFGLFFLPLFSKRYIVVSRKYSFLRLGDTCFISQRIYRRKRDLNIDP